MRASFLLNITMGNPFIRILGDVRTMSKSNESDDPNSTNSSELRGTVPVLSDNVFDCDAKISALDKERAKVEVVTRQLDRVSNENKMLEYELKRTQKQLENQMKQTLQLRKQQQSQNAAYYEQRALENNSDDRRMEDLKSQLQETQTDLAKEISLAQQREAKLHKVVDQNAKYEKELYQLKAEQCKKEENMLAMKHLERQRDELLNVVTHQMKLMEVLKKQVLHEKGRSVLNITEKDFMNELNLKQREN